MQPSGQWSGCWGEAASGQEGRAAGRRTSSVAQTSPAGMTRVERTDSSERPSANQRLEKSQPKRGRGQQGASAEACGQGRLQPGWQQAPQRSPDSAPVARSRHRRCVCAVGFSGSWPAFRAVSASSLGGWRKEYKCEGSGGGRDQGLQCLSSSSCGRGAGKELTCSSRGAAPASARSSATHCSAPPPGLARQPAWATWSSSRAPAAARAARRCRGDGGPGARWGRESAEEQQHGRQQQGGTAAARPEDGRPGASAPEQGAVAGGLVHDADHLAEQRRLAPAHRGRVGCCFVSARERPAPALAGLRCTLQETARQKAACSAPAKTCLFR